MPVGMIFVPAKLAPHGSEYEIWAHTWEAIKALPNLRAVEVSAASRGMYFEPAQVIMDLESIAAVNRRIQFYLVIYGPLDRVPDPGLTRHLPGFTVSVDVAWSKETVRHIMPLNTHTVQAALADLGMVWSWAKC